MAKPLIIVASARSDGHTARVAAQLREQLGADLIDLLDYRIAPFDYLNAYPEGDEFMRVVDRILHHDHLILASPVYWYSMSGGMKNFLDRFTDLLTHHRDTGRRLRGKRLGVLSCANDEEVVDSFYEAFRLSAGYLGMDYGPAYHGWVNGEEVTIVERPG